MKITVTHTCGHTCTIDVFGKSSDRQSKIEYYESVPCKECMRKAEIEKAEKETQHLPALTGSEKQVAWATRIRADFLKNAHAYEAEINEFEGKCKPEELEAIRSIFYTGLERILNGRTKASAWIEMKEIRAENQIANAAKDKWPENK